MGLRILLVSDVYAPIIGGAERQIQLIGREMQARGHTISVATAWQVGLAEHEDDGGIDIHRLKGLSSRVPWFSTNPARRHHPPLPDPATVWSLRRLIDRFRPDVVHSYGWITYSCAVALIGRSTPLLVSIREYAHSCALRTLVEAGERPCSGPALGKCLRCATGFYGLPKGLAAVVGVFSGWPLLRWRVNGLHYISTYVRDVTRRDLFGGREPTAGGARPGCLERLIPSFREQGADVSVDLTPYQSRLAELPSEPFILFVGALRRVKGIEPLLAAYRRLASAPPLVLIGPVAPDTPREYPPGVTVLHDLPHPAVMAAWERCLFGVAPSIWPEPFGSVIHEAMSRGKAIIGTTPGGHTDMIVPDETGLLVPPGDVVALTQAMQRLINEPGLRERLGAAGRRRAALYTAASSIPLFEQLYQQLAAAAQP